MQESVNEDGVYKICNGLICVWAAHNCCNLQLDIKAFASHVRLSTSDFVSEEHWEIISTDGARVQHMYDCCVEPYPAMEYVLRLRDKTLGSISIG